MVQKIGTFDEFQFVLETLPDKIQNIFAQGEVRDNIDTALQILDSCYGKNRDSEQDGGYMAILYGKMTYQQVEYRELLERYHLHPNEYEFEDHYQKPEYDAEVVFRLYLCGSDYSIVIVQIIEKGEYTL